MKKPSSKIKTAGAGAQQSEEAPAEVLRPMKDGPIVFGQEPDATPPDIIVEN
jgi:hypothetical protein